MSPSRLSRAVRRATWRVACAVGLGCGLAGCVDLVARTPAATIAAANAAINAALKDKAVIDSLAIAGLQASGSTPEEMSRSQRAEFERWGPLVKRIGFTAES